MPDYITDLFCHCIFDIFTPEIKGIRQETMDTDFYLFIFFCTKCVTVLFLLCTSYKKVVGSAL